MVFSSLLFLFFFLPLFLILYFCLPKQCRNYVLLFFSLVFYAWGEPVYVFLMLGMTFSDYLLGLLMQKFDQKKTARLLCLLASLIIDLGCLCSFKYLDFLIGSVNGIFRTNLPLREIALPIGISFFTFQTLSYTIDLYKRQVTAEKNYFEYLMYVSMFPQLIAGPIVRYSTVRSELHNRAITKDAFYEGFIRFTYGLLKKVLLANRLGALWDEAKLASAGDMSVLFAWLGALTFTLQLYLDFSAYSDMAIGLGKMLGFSFPENFVYPLSADSVTDFWRRWHISLSTWFRDYVYIPLGGNRCGKARQILNLAIVWMLTGLWHGASWNYVLWGVYYGTLLILEKFVWGKALQKLPAFFRHLYLLVIVVLGFTLFAIEDFSALGRYFACMFGAGGAFVSKEILHYLVNYGFVLVSAILVSMPLFPALKKWLEAKNDKTRAILGGAWMLFLGLLILSAFSYMVGDTYNPFLYFRF